MTEHETPHEMRNRILDEAVILRSRFSSEELYLLHQFLEPVVRDAEYPALIVRLTPETDENYGHRDLVCPHCEAVLTDEEGSEYTQLRMVDIAYRWTSMMVDTDGAREVYAHYDGYGDYESLVYQCEVCDRPVSLPEGWTESS